MNLTDEELLRYASTMEPSRELVEALCEALRIALDERDEARECIDDCGPSSNLNPTGESK